MRFLRVLRWREEERGEEINGCEFTELDFGLPLKTGPILLIFFFGQISNEVVTIVWEILFQRNITH